MLCNFTFVATFNADRIFVPKLRGRCVAYLRSSSLPYSRLKLEAQRRTVTSLLQRNEMRLKPEGKAKRVPARWIKSFEEDEPLTGDDRPALKSAVDFCKANNTILILAKFDRIRGFMRWLDYLHTQRVRFIAADAPHINQTNYFDLVRAEEARRDNVGEAIKAGLAAAKVRGQALGGKRKNASGLRLGPRASAEWRSYIADTEARSTMSVIESLRKQGVTSLTELANRLNADGFTAPRGGKWSPVQVRRVIMRTEKRAS